MGHQKIGEMNDDGEVLNGVKIRVQMGHLTFKTGLQSLQYMDFIFFL